MRYLRIIIPVLALQGLLLYANEVEAGTEARTYPPTANLANPYNGDTFYEGQTVFLYAYGSTGNGSAITQYRWRMRPTGGSWTNISWSYSDYYSFPSLAPGQRSQTYELQLTVWNSYGSDSETIQVTVVRDYEDYYYLKDHLGSIRTTINDQGDVVGYDDYYPFGLTITGRSSNTGNPNDNYKYTGHELDDEANLNLYYAGARMYDPVVPRFLQIDLLHMERPGLSPFNYAQNNPLTRIDPNGMLDVYYDENGNYLGEDELETDYVWITSKENYEANVEQGGAVVQENSTAITDAKLSLEGWSNLFTDVFDKAGYSTDYMLNGKISVANYENRDAGMGITQEYMVGNYNNASNGTGIMNTWMSGSQHAILTLNTFESGISSQLGTIANIQSSFVHEMRHYKEMRSVGKAMNFGASGEIRAYREQMNHPTFRRTTSGFQNFIRSNCRDYGGCKN